MAPIVYILSAITSLSCAILLMRAYARSRARMLLWSCLCFFGLTLNNVLLYVDLVVIPTGPDLSVLRAATTFLSLLLLLYGLIYEAA